MTINSRSSSDGGQLILQAEGISKHFPGVQALTNVNLGIASGELHAIIGPNGAGKSTFFSVVSGETLPTEGQISYDGRIVSGLSPHNISRRGMARVFQVPRIFRGLSVRENVLIAVLGSDRCAGRHPSFREVLSPSMTRKAEVDEILRTYSLLEVAEKESDMVSHGHKKRLEVAMALALDPKILLLDEPTAGMAPDETSDTVRLLQRLKESLDLTMVLTEHDMEVVFTLADRITVLNRGEILVTGAPHDIRQDERVQEVYLGKEVA